MDLIVIILLAFALVASVLAHPATVEPPKYINFHVFPEFAGLDSLNQLVYNDTLDGEYDNNDIEARSPEATKASQCTLANLKKIMFDYST